MVTFDILLYQVKVNKVPGAEHRSVTSFPYSALFISVILGIGLGTPSENTWMCMKTMLKDFSLVENRDLLEDMRTVW